MTRRAPGTGSIKQLASGRWKATIRLWDGHLKTRLTYTREAGEEAIKQMMRENEGRLGYFYTVPWEFHARTEPRPERVRKNMSPKTRFAVFERDGFRCTYCGATAQDDRLVVDHIIPVARGGSNDLKNLTTACSPCNLGKAAQVLREVGA